MPFVRVPGLKGLVWEPETHAEQKKKHPCKDCHHCQMCGDDRCTVCLGPGPDQSKNKTCTTVKPPKTDKTR